MNKKGTLLKITDCGGSTKKNDTGLLFACCCDFWETHPCNSINRGIDLYHHKFKFTNVLNNINSNFSNEHKPSEWRKFFEKKEEYDPFTILYSRNKFDRSYYQ
jgi:hypothetical protein